MEKGPYMVFLNERLVTYSNRTIKTYDWKQFSNNIEMNIAKNELTLELNSGKVFDDDGSKKFVPTAIFISGVQNVVELEKLMRSLIGTILP